MSIINFAPSADLAKNNAGKMGLLQMLYSILPKEIQLIQSAQQSNSRDDLRELFHNMQGGLSYVSAPVLQKALTELHAAVKSEQGIAEIEPLFAKFYQECDMLLQAYEGIEKLAVSQQESEMMEN